jgi:hypothetical protein
MDAAKGGKSSRGKIAEIAREKRKELEREEYNNIIEIVQSGRTYEYVKFTAILAKMQKPFSCMMETSALDEISKILVSNKRENTNETGPAPK